MNKSLVNLIIINMGNNISRICACNDAGNPQTGEANLVNNEPNK